MNLFARIASRKDTIYDLKEQSPPQNNRNGPNIVIDLVDDEEECNQFTKLKTTLSIHEEAETSKETIDIFDDDDIYHEKPNELSNGTYEDIDQFHDTDDDEDFQNYDSEYVDEETNDEDDEDLNGISNNNLRGSTGKEVFIVDDDDEEENIVISRKKPSKVEIDLLEYDNVGILNRATNKEKKCLNSVLGNNKLREIEPAQPSISAHYW
jgi:hypothetical protein